MSLLQNHGIEAVTQETSLNFYAMHTFPNLLQAYNFSVPID